MTWPICMFYYYYNGELHSYVCFITITMENFIHMTTNKVKCLSICNVLLIYSYGIMNYVINISIRI